MNFRNLRGLLPPGGQNLQAPWCAASLPGLKAKNSNLKKIKKILIWGNFGALGGPLGPPGGDLVEFLGESFGPLITASSGFCFGPDPKQNPEDAAISGPKLHMVRQMA